MLDTIRTCTKCTLCQNQKPLLDNIKKCQVFWVGLSAKKISCESDKPLSVTTNSGKLICSVEEKFLELTTYKTNLVKCLPLDDQQKLRYPNKFEMDACLNNLQNEISELAPQIVFLLGDKVVKAVSKRMGLSFESWDGFNYTYLKRNGIYYVSIHHPSYIHVYKRKNTEQYISAIQNLISNLL